MGRKRKTSDVFIAQQMPKRNLKQFLSLSGLKEEKSLSNNLETRLPLMDGVYQEITQKSYLKARYYSFCREKTTSQHFLNSYK